MLCQKMFYQYQYLWVKYPNLLMHEQRVCGYFVSEVVRVVANSGSYKALSTEHWLEAAKLKYHDQVVFDYLEENYPDLFEE